MATLVDSDVHRAASYRNMIEHLTAPLQSGAVDSDVTIDETGLVQVAWSARLPLLLLAPLAALDQDGLRVDATLPGGDVVTLEFAPYSEQGAFLPVHRPSVDGTGFAAPFEMQLAAPPLAESELAATFEARLLEGNLGVILYLLAAEKQRLRRQARELTAMRLLAHARDDALDRTGAELGVPRFADTLAFRGGAIVTDVRREPDDEYRRRLRLYRPWFLPTRGRIDEVLNGPGSPADPNAGALGELGLAARFSLVETDNDFGVAIAIVGADDPAYRAGLLAFVRASHLIWPANNASANAVHAARFLPDAQRARVEQLRANLREYLDFSTAGADAALAPMLADALARAGACRFALGASAPWGVLRAQADAGSRYELGLGADLAPLTAQELTDLAAAHANRAPNPDPELEALLASMTPQPPTDDPGGGWLLVPCGLQTVHHVDSGRLYVSNLPVFGLTIAGPTQLQPAGWTQILAGRFSDNAFDDVLFYERATGAGEFWSSDGRGGLAPFNQQTGWRTTWTTIVRGDFTPSSYDDLFFYERSTGSAELWSTDGAGNIALVRSYSGLRDTWSAIVAGSFRPDSPDGLFFYDRSAGVGELYATDGNGNLTLLAQHTDLRRTFTHVVAGMFTAGPLTDLLFYDRVTGTAEVYATDGNGGLALVRRLEQWEPGWTDVIAGSFGGVDGFTDLLVYNRGAGTAELHASDGAGGVVRLRSFDDWRTTWTQIVPARLVRRPLVSQTSDLLFYERATGNAEVQSTGADGTLSLARTLTGWRQSSGQTYEAQFLAPGDPAGNVVLVTGLADAASAWSGPAWTVLADAQAHARWQAAAAPAPGTLDVFRAAGLPALADPAAAMEPLLRLPAELLVTIRLGGAQATPIVAGQEAAVAPLRELVALMQANGIASALPLVTASSEVLLVLGAIGLPQAGINLSDRRSSGFRWYLVPIQGTGGTLTAVGSRTLFTPAGAGVYALVVVGYARTGETDPYEYRVDLPSDAMLTPLQYEFLMNALDQTYPIGVEVNTYAIRQNHVDLDGDGSADPLTPTVSKTYRAFRRRRHRGQAAVTLDES